VTINGSGFGASQGSGAVTFNQQNGTIGSWSDTQIVATVPANAATGPVQVTSGGVAGNSNVQFTVASPQITSLTPNIGGSGNSITIAGTNFGSNSAYGQVVFFGGGAWTPTSWSNTQIVAKVPSNSSTDGVKVSVNGMASNVANFTVPAHVISSV